jgi:hypothetical protein
MSLIWVYTHLVDCDNLDSLRPFTVVLMFANASLHTFNSLNEIEAHHQAIDCDFDLPMLRTPD